MNPSEQKLSMSQLDMIRLFEPACRGAQTVFGFKDMALRYQYVNNEFLRIVDRTRDDVIGSTLDSFASTDTIQSQIDAQSEVLSTGRASRYICKNRFGKRFVTMAITYFPTYDDKEKINGVGFIGISIQDHIWMDTSMQGMLAKAEATIIDLQKRVDDMRLQATTDPLTGVWNRIQAEVIGKQEMAKQDRNNGYVSIVFADLDYFKKINDTWGHSVGDSVLIEFCNVIQDCLRAVDVLARWGGEEFIIILPDTGLESAEKVVNRIRYAMTQHRFPIVETITASFGIAAYMRGESWHKWIERVDAALYRAKTKGRNCVEMDRTGLPEKTSGEAVHNDFLRLTWRASYECGNAVIDRQHRKLFAHANNLLSAVIADKQEESVTLLVEALLICVAEHCHDETEILKKTGYPDTEEHEKIHADLLEKAFQLAKRYYAGKLDLREIFSFLAYDIIAQHMLIEDRDYFPFLKGHESTKLEKKFIAPKIFASPSEKLPEPGISEKIKEAKPE